MAEEIKNQGRDLEADKKTGESALGQAEPESKAGSEASKEAAESQVPETITNNHIAQKRGRMVAAGLIASVILAVIAVVVAGIFQFTSGWLLKCSGDLPVNDPAPVLWKTLESKGVQKAPLGVPEKLLKQASWKGSTTAQETLSQESK